MKKDLTLNQTAIIVLRKMYEQFGLKWLTKDPYSMYVFEHKPRWDDGSWEAVTGTSCCLCAASYENYIQSFNLDITPKEISIRTTDITTEQPINLIPYIYPDESHEFYVGEKVWKPEEGSDNIEEYLIDDLFVEDDYMKNHPESVQIIAVLKGITTPGAIHAYCEEFYATAEEAKFAAKTQSSCAIEDYKVKLTADTKEQTPEIYLAAIQQNIQALERIKPEIREPLYQHLADCIRFYRKIIEFLDN